MIPRHDLDYGANSGVWLAIVIIAMIFVLSLFIGLVCGELPPGMHLTVEVRVDTVWNPVRTRSSRILDSMMHADSLNACHDSIRPRQRQRLDGEDSAWLKSK